MIPLPILLDRVGELSTTIAYQRLTVAAVSWVDLDDGTLPPPGRQVARAVVRAASEADDAAADARSLTFLLLDDPDAAALSRLGKNVVAVLTVLSPLAFAQQLQACALELMEWERALDRIALADGTLQDFLTASEAVIGNFINISDSSFRLIAYTKGIVLDAATTTRQRSRASGPPTPWSGGSASARASITRRPRERSTRSSTTCSG